MSIAVPVVTLLGMLIEMIGVVVFTLDVLEANNENIRRANEFVPVEHKVSAIVLSDGPNGKIDFQGAGIRQRDGEKLQKIEIGKRVKLRLGAWTVLVGFTAQVLAQVCSIVFA